MTVPLSHTPGPQGVPTLGPAWHAPLPLQKPGAPHGGAGPGHSLSGSLAALMKPHTPLLPLPFFASVHAEQAPVHVVLQQTLSTQLPDMQSRFIPHGDPSTPFVVMPLELDAELEVPAPPVLPLELDAELVGPAPPALALLELDAELTGPPAPEPPEPATLALTGHPAPEPPEPATLALTGPEPPPLSAMDASRNTWPPSTTGANPPMFIRRLPGAPPREGPSLPSVEEHAAATSAAAP